MFTQRTGRPVRVALASIATAGLIVGLAACASEPASSDKPVELTFQAWVPNIDKAVDAFNAEHDDIHVTLETITAGPDGGYAKMLSAVQAGNPADIAQVGYSDIPDFLV